MEAWYREAVKEAWNDGYAAHVPGGATVDYVYHEHHTDLGNTIESVIYSDECPGGCYITGSHTHNKTQTCTTSTCGGSYKSISWHQYWDGCDWHSYSNTGAHQYQCTRCGAINRKTWKQGEKEPAAPTSCGQTTYTCGSPSNTWKVGCGKTPGVTIEQAIITYE